MFINRDLLPVDVIYLIRIVAIHNLEGVYGDIILRRKKKTLIVGLVLDTT